jgi:hypothetical protein
VKPGEVVTKTLLVRSGQPFKITGVKASRDDVTAAADPGTGTDPGAAAAKTDRDAEKTLHTVKLTFKVPNQPGPYNAVCEVATSLKDEPPAKVTLFATVVP